MSVDEAKQYYISLSEDIFTRKNRLRDSKFDAKALESVMKRVVKERMGNENEPLVEHD